MRRESLEDRIAEWAVVGGIALTGILLVAPIVIVALPALALLYALRHRPWWVQWGVSLLLAAPAAVIVFWTYRESADPYLYALGYLDVQLDAAAAAIRQTFDLPVYVRSVGPYAAVCGPFVAALAYLLTTQILRPGPTVGNLRLTDPGEGALSAKRKISYVVEKVIARGYVTLLSAPPGLGKGWWTWGWLRAMQDGPSKFGTFFGLHVWRPTRKSWRGDRQPQRVLWCTEEGPSFEENCAKFGVRPGLVRAMYRPEVHSDDPETIIRMIRQKAYQYNCGVVIIDTIRAWFAEAEQNNVKAGQIFRLVRDQLAAPGLAVLVIHHDRKAGGEHGEGVAGPNNLVGQCDCLVELRRVRGNPTARKMIVSRRLWEGEVTAVLEGHRFNVLKEREPESEPVVAAGSDSPVPKHLVPVLEKLRKYPEGTDQDTLQVALGAAGSTLYKQLTALAEGGWASSTGRGRKGSKKIWTATDAPTARPANPTANPEYEAYLGSQEWKRRAAEIRSRAGHVCEECGEAPSDGDTLEVHHLTYERIFNEDPDDLVALCSSCHRKAHGKPNHRRSG